MNARDWYWIIGDRGTYASARNVMVGEADEAYAGWKAAGHVAHVIASEAELWEVLQARAPGLLADWLFDGVTFVQPAEGQYTPAQLRSYAAQLRYAREIAGITFDGAPVRTDRESQALINGAYSAATRDPSFTTRWKTAAGAFVSLDASAITAIATAVAAHVAACFGIEATVSDLIATGAISSLANVEAKFA